MSGRLLSQPVVLLSIFSLAAGAPAGVAFAQENRATISQPAPRASAVERRRAHHILNRLAFGPRHGDVDRVLQTGVDRWIEQQLSADSVLDKPALNALQGCDIWYEPVDIAVARVTGIERFSAAGANMVGGMRLTLAGTTGFRGFVTWDSIRALVAADGGASSTAAIFAANAQLFGCRLARVEFSDNQLLEVMTDFWHNHFSVYGLRTPARGSLVELDRAIIRPRALGKFRDLLGAVARSPAMLAYLDNSTSGADPTRRTLADVIRARTSPPASFSGPRVGLNENYARELLELHTMGVDAGYSQTDVTEVARAFTGWRDARTFRVGPNGDVVTNTAPTGYRLTFMFDTLQHDAEPKIVLGKTLPGERGMEDGEDVLDMLARHPSTARHIARKLAVRFVSDDPPKELVNRAAATFTKTDGDIRAVMRTIVTSPEFLSPSAFGAKVKSPLEYILSMRRAMNAPVDTVAELIGFLVELDQPPYGRVSPDGWPETGGAWMNVGAMSTRIEIASRVATGAYASIPVDAWPEWTRLSQQPLDVQLDGVVTHILGGTVSAGTRRAMAATPGEGPATAASEPRTRAHVLRDLLAMALASPEFQRR